MKYKVVKEFGSAKKGDLLEEDETGLVSFYIEEGNMTRSMSLDYDTADYMCEEEYLLAIEDRSAQDKVSDTLELIDSLLNQYDKDAKDTMEKADRGEVQPCVRVEAETVYYNLNKVLNKIRESLTNLYK